MCHRASLIVGLEEEMSTLIVLVTCCNWLYLRFLFHQVFVPRLTSTIYSATSFQIML